MAAWRGVRIQIWDGSLARRADPDMAVVEQEVDSMFLELNRERRTLRNLLDDLDFTDTDFVTARCALLGANSAGDNNAGFLRETFERCECLRRFL